MYKILYFSPTGNVKHLAIKLSHNLNNSELLPLEFTEYKDLEKSEHIIIMFAIHGFNSPRTVNRFIKKIPNNLNTTFSIISVGCTDIWVNKASSLQVRKYLTKKEYTIVVDEQLNMPLTINSEFPIEYSMKIIKKSTENIKRISNEIINRVATKNIIPTKSKVVTTIGKLEDPASRLFGLELHANKKCTSCGLCIDQCPEKNIKMGKNYRPKFGFKCLMCLRCIYNCPEQAINPLLSKFIPIKGGYKLNL